MSIHRFGIMALATLATLGIATVSDAGFIRHTVQGKFVKEPARGAPRGMFRLTSRTLDSGAIAERIHAECWNLDATKVDDKRPDYHLWLVRADASASADFGRMRLNPQGHAWLKFNSNLDAYPEGTDLISDFGGGTIEVRRGDTVVLSVAVPRFDGDGAVGVRHDTNRLAPPENGRGRGWVEARRAERPKGGVNEQLRIQITNLARSMGPYTAVAIAGDLTETALGTLVPHGNYGQDREVYDTRKGGTIPGGGGVAGLSEQRVEIRDKNGAVVLSGTFPKTVAE